MLSLQPTWRSNTFERKAQTLLWTGNQTPLQHNASLTTFQGATTQQPPIQDPSFPDVRNTFRDVMETATVADRIGRYDSSAIPNSDSNLPTPEVGSVKDKIGIFGTKSLATRPKDVFDQAPRDILPPTSRTSDQDAYLPTTQKLSSSTQERISTIVDIDERKTQDAAQSHSDGAKETLDASMLRPITKTGDRNPIQNTPENDEQPQPKKSKPPPIPRKPVKLTHAKPSESGVPPMEHSVDPSEPESNTSPRSELPSVIGRSRSPRPYNYNSKPSPDRHVRDDSGQPTPPSKEFKPKLPPRTGTSSSEQSASSYPSLNSLSSDSKPALPPRRKTPSISRKPTRSQGIYLVDNESPSSSTPSVASSSRSFNGSYPRLSGGGSPLTAGQTSAKKVPPPPPRQRRTGLQSVPPGEPDRNFIRTQSINSPQTPLSSSSSDVLSQRYRQETTPIPSIPRKARGNDQINSKPIITEEEEKRYESVWLANKGLFIPGPNEPCFDMYPPGASEMVLNLVTRDIWSRSRLPNEVLGQVWDLVDRQNIRLLTREEFIVGMWLIDQILKGNRLPPKVPDSIWSSLDRSHKPDTSLI